MRRSRRGWRSRGAPPTSAGGGGAPGPSSRPSAAFLAEQALRPREQQDEGQRVDEERAALREVDLQHEIKHADQDRGEEHAADAAQSAHRHDDEEIGEIAERVLRIEAEDFGAKAAANRREAAAEREGQREEEA